MIVNHNVKVDLPAYIEAGLKVVLERDAQWRQKRLFTYKDIPPERNDLLPPVELVRAQARQALADEWQLENRKGPYATMSQQQWEAEIDRRDQHAAEARKAGQPAWAPKFNIYDQKEWKQAGPRPVYAQLSDEYGLNYSHLKIEK